MTAKAPPLKSTTPPTAGMGRLARDLLQLSKPRITFMVLVATAVGYLLGERGGTDWIYLAGLLVATALVGAGVNALNQYMERDVDGLMARTRDRPLPAGRMRPGTVLVLGSAASGAGVALLAVWANPLAGVLGALVVVTYLLCYTPMKRHSELNTLVGAIPGAVPPVLGWAAARENLGVEALALFLIMFLWQPPHFFSIATLYRDEYERAGMPMLTVVDPGGKTTGRLLIIYTATLVPVALYPTVIGLTGTVYFFGALALGLAFFAAALGLALRPSQRRASLLLRVSVLYLPLLFVLMLYDAIPFGAGANG